MTIRNGIFLIGFLLGWLGPVVWFPQAQAAPQDVHGSANLAVGGFRNRLDSFVLWGNGRITQTQGSSQDLGHPYRQPAPQARIADPSYENGQPMGSPNLAVKALVRADGTYVLFANGSLRRPAAELASAGAPRSQSRTIGGGWSLDALAPVSLQRRVGKCTVDVNPNRVQVISDEPLTPPFEGFLVTGTASAWACLTNLQSSSDGRTFTFSTAMQLRAPPAQANPPIPIPGFPIPQNTVPQQYFSVLHGHFLIRERR